MTPKSEKLYSLAYLSEVIGDDTDVLNDLMKIFVDNTPNDLNDLNQAFQAGDLEKFAALAHKMKSSLATLRIDTLREIMLSIDKPYKAIEIKDQLPGIVAKINATLEVVFKQIKNDFKL